MSPDFNSIVLGVGAVITTASGVWMFGRGAARRGRRLADFLDDWAGEPARSGVPARPGVMQRLESIEAELHPNGGGSLRDAVDRTGSRLVAVESRLAAVESRLASVEAAAPSQMAPPG